VQSKIDVIIARVHTATHSIPTDDEVMVPVHISDAAAGQAIDTAPLLAASNQSAPARDDGR
jgi:hypothetical protein